METTREARRPWTLPTGRQPRACDGAVASYTIMCATLLAVNRSKGQNISTFREQKECKSKRELLSACAQIRALARNCKAQ
eukprot:2244215-Pleurochrysis_carterae.AAC.1